MSIFEIILKNSTKNSNKITGIIINGKVPEKLGKKVKLWELKRENVNKIISVALSSKGEKNV